MNKALIVILSAVLLDAIGMGIIMPILPGLLRELSHTSTTSSTHYGALLAAYALMQFLFAPILGALSDRFGRRPVLLISLAGAAADYLFMAAAPSLAWLYVGRILAGITGANLAVATAYITDITAEPDRAKRFGQMGAVMGIGFIIGPLLGGTLGEWSLRAPFVAAAALNAANLVLAYFVLPESRAPQAAPARRISFNAFASLHRLQGKPALLPLTSIFIIIALVGQVPMTLWIIYGQDSFGWSTTVAGISIAGYGAFHALSQAFMIAPAVRWLGERGALLLGLLADGTGLLLLALIMRSWIPFALLPLFAMGGMTLPALQAMLSRQVDESRQGELQGTLASIASLIGVAGPLAATAAYAASRSTWPGMVWAIAAALYLPVVPLLYSRRLREI
nr:TetA [uncultured bacterium]